MHVAIFGGLARQEITQALQGISGVRVSHADKAEDLEPLLATIDGVITTSVLYQAPIAQRLKEAASQLRWVQFLSAGFESAEFYGIPQGAVFTNAGEAWSPAVAEHGMALLLGLSRCLPEALGNQQAGKWSRQFFLRMRALSGLTMAIVGFGSIGRETAIRARPFGMRIIGVNRSGRAHELADAMFPVERLDEALAEADVVLIALPQTTDTEKLFDADRLNRCKPGTLLINVARGSIVDSAALEEALRSGHLGGAGIDVTDPEPLPDGHSLWSAPNLIISPHVAGAPNQRFRDNLAQIVRANAEAVLAGERAPTQVDITPLQRAHA